MIMGIKNKPAVLFVVENNPLPDDPRPLREALSLLETGNYRVFGLCPRGRHKSSRSLFENYQGLAIYRYPRYESVSIAGMLIEYTIAALMIMLYTLWILIRHRIKIIHAANPPDFIIPMFAFLKLLRVKLIFDQHDMSIEVFTSKVRGENPFIRITIALLRFLEILSFTFADAVIVTNATAKDSAIRKTSIDPKSIYIVQNSPRSSDIPDSLNLEKPKDSNYTIGYIGIMGNESGTEN